MAYGLIFDVDGVIADTETMIALATIDMFKELYGHDFQVANFAPYVGMGAVKYTAGPAASAGLSIDLDRALAVREEKFVERLNTAPHSIAFPGVLELISAAAADPNWKIALATSSVRSKSEATLKAARVDTSLINSWITGDQIKRLKPNAEIYVTAALTLRLPPTRCIAIEDAPAGIQSAKDGCLKCIAVTNTFAVDKLDAADRVVSSLEEVTLDLLTEIMTEKQDEQITWGARRVRP